MTIKEAIKHCEERAKKCDECGKEHAQLAEWLNELLRYREMDKKLREAYGDCDGLLERFVGLLCEHAGIDIGEPIKVRLLTDEDVDKWDAYREIGTVEECREAMEKQKVKYIKKEAWSPTCCPTCGYELSTHMGDGYYKQLTYLKRCPKCGQLITWNRSTNYEKWE